MTVKNPADGATTISTATKTWSANTATTLNNQISVKQADRTVTTGLTTTGNNGKIKPSVTDATGTHKLKEGGSLLEPDGTVISYVNGALDIGQHLTRGGNLDGSHYAYNRTQNRVFSDVTANAGYGNASL